MKTVLTALEKCCALRADVKASDLQKYFDTVKQGEAKIWKEFLGSKANPGAAALVKAVTSRVKTCIEDEKHSRTVKELREILVKKPEIPITDIGRWSEVFGKASMLRKTTSSAFVDSNKDLLAEVETKMVAFRKHLLDTVRIPYAAAVSASLKVITAEDNGPEDKIQERQQQKSVKIRTSFRTAS